MVEHRKVTDLLHSWEERIHKQAQHFETFATQILQVDTEIIANAGKVKNLRAEHAQLKSRQEAADQSIMQILEQQDALGRLLTSLQEALKAQAPQGNEIVRPTQNHHRARVLSVQLDELDRQADDLARETQAVQSALYAEPLTTVVRVLDSHASALDSMQSQVIGMVDRIRVVESTL